MKKVLIFTVVMLTLLTGCAAQSSTPEITPVPEQPVSLDSFRAGKYTATINADGEYMYFVRNDGIYRMKNGSTSEELIYPCTKSIDSLAVYDGRIYFVENAPSYQFVFCSIKTDGTDEQQHFTTEGENLNLSNRYQISDGKIYFVALTGAAVWDIAERELKEIELNNPGADYFQVVGDHLYYICHGKTFTVYDVDLTTGEETVLTGSGVHRPESDLYSNFAFVDGTLFVCKRIPYGLYMMTEDGELQLIDETDRSQELPNNNIEQILPKDGKLYYIKDNALYSYKKGDQSPVKLADLEGYEFTNGVTIVGNYVYYSTDDGPAAVRINAEG